MWSDFHKASVRRQREAEELIAQFHQRFNAGDFDAICRDAYKCSEFQNLRKDWQAALEETRNRGGAFRRVLHSDIKVYIEPASVRADVVSAFEKAELREIFVMKDYDGPLKIVTYQTVSKESASATR
jgi:hypothetical protein